MKEQFQSKGSSMIRSGYKECPVCLGSGYEIIKESAGEHYGNDTKIEFAVPCSYCNGAVEKRSIEAKESANIPVAFYDADISKFNRDIYMSSEGKKIDISKQMKLVDDFIENFQRWDAEGFGLYIYSSMKGSGKTFLASCICNSLIKKYPMMTRFVSASSLLDLSKQEKTSEGYYGTDNIGLLCNAKLLVIDDLGQKTGGFDWMQDILFRITDTRMQNNLVTIFTSNIKMENLPFDDRIVDRISRKCVQFSLPECCIRAQEGCESKIKFLSGLGLV